MSGTDDDQTYIDPDELYRQQPPLSPEERERGLEELQSTWTEREHAVYARLEKELLEEKQHAANARLEEELLEWKTGPMGEYDHLEWDTGT